MKVIVEVERKAGEQDFQVLADIEYALTRLGSEQSFILLDIREAPPGWGEEEHGE